MIVVSDGESFSSAAITGSAEQDLQGVQNHSIFQFLTWHVIERSGHKVVVISDLKHAASYVGVIGQPKQLEVN